MNVPPLYLNAVCQTCTYYTTGEHSGTPFIAPGVCQSPQLCWGIYTVSLKELRKEKGYTQIKMQHLTGIDQSDYSKIENGKRYLTFEQCRRIAIALDTSMDYLAGLTDEKNPYPRSASLENQG